MYSLPQHGRYPQEQIATMNSREACTYQKQCFIVSVTSMLTGTTDRMIDKFDVLHEVKKFKHHVQIVTHSLHNNQLFLIMQRKIIYKKIFLSVS